MKQFIKYDPVHLSFAGSVEGIGFRQDNHEVIYIPSLNLSAYGDTVDDAQQMMNTVVNEFLKGVMESSPAQVFEMLRELGWRKNRILPKKYVQLSTTTFEDIAREFNLPADTPTTSIPVTV